MKCLTLTLLLCAVAPLQAQSWLPEPTLAAQAIAAQPEVQAARDRVDAARAQAQARDAGPHEFIASAIVQHRTADEPTGERGFREYEWQLTRGIRLPGKAALDRSIGAYGVEAAELRLDDARHQAARRLLERWIAWLRADAQVRAHDARLASLQRERVALACRVQLGDAARKDLDLLDVELAQGRAQQLAAASAALLARQALRTGFPLLPLPERTPQVGEVPTLADAPEVLVQHIVERSHEIGAIQADAAQADALAARSRADRLPDPNLGLRLMQDRGGAERAIGLVFSMPIGGRHRRALAAADSAAAAALHGDVATMRREILSEAEHSVETAQARYRQWQAQQQALVASDAATRRLHRGWQLGELALSDWLLAARAQGQIALGEAEGRIAAEEARLRVLVDAHELWHDE